MNKNPAPAHSPAKKWFRRGFIAFAIFASMVGLVYEASTHVVRGWLRGEAFYDGRPTSYWAVQCDRWLARFDTPEDAVGSAEGPLGFSAKKPNSDELVHFAVQNFGLAGRFSTSPRKSHLDRAMDWMAGRQNDNYGPKVLRGYLGSEEVASELALVARFEWMAKNSLRRAQHQRELREQLLREGFQPMDEY